MFGFKQPSNVLSKKDFSASLARARVYPLNAVFKVLEHIEEMEIEPVDYTVSQSMFGKTHSVDSTTHFTRITGHYVARIFETQSFTAKVYVRLHKDGLPLMERDAAHYITINGSREFEVIWGGAEAFRFRRWRNGPGVIADGWTNCDVALRIDQLGLSSPLENFLYSHRIWTLRSILLWTSVGLLRLGITEPQLEELKKILRTRRYKLNDPR
jgi:hypothetical protein